MKKTLIHYRIQFINLFLCMALVMLVTASAGCGNAASESMAGNITITNAAVNNVTAKSAVITWTTSEPATSNVSFGTTASCETSLPALKDTTPDSTSHNVAVYGLAKGTEYHYRIVSEDKNARTVSSDIAAFSTPDEIDETAPLVSNIQVTAITDSKAVISWDTNEPATTQVKYGLDTGYGIYAPEVWDMIATKVNHSVEITGLLPATEYHYLINCRDTSHNEAVVTDATFTTAAYSGPPCVSNIRFSNISRTSITVLWNTNVDATTNFYYGKTESYGSQMPPATDTTTDTKDHTIELTGLDPGATYHFKISGKDSAGMEGVYTGRLYTSVIDSMSGYAIDAENDYIVYEDSGSIYCKEYNGGAWTDKGGAAVGTDGTDPRITVIGSVPYVSFSDTTDNNISHVYRFDSSWTGVGSPFKTSDTGFGGDFPLYGKMMNDGVNPVLSGLERGMGGPEIYNGSAAFNGTSWSGLTNSSVTGGYIADPLKVCLWRMPVTRAGNATYALIGTTPDDYNTIEVKLYTHSDGDTQWTAMHHVLYSGNKHPQLFDMTTDGTSVFALVGFLDTAVNSLKVLRYTDTGWKQLGGNLLVNPAKGGDGGCLRFLKGRLYAAWKEGGGGSNYARAWDGASWVLKGEACLNPYSYNTPNGMACVPTITLNNNRVSVAVLDRETNLTSFKIAIIDIE